MASKKPKAVNKAINFFRRNRLVRHFFQALILTLLIFQGIIDYLVYNNFYRNSDVSNISHLIIAAVDNEKQPVPIEASTGKRYLAQVRLALPADNVNLGQLDYSYYSPQDGSAAMLQLTQRRLVKAVESRMLSLNQTGTIWSTRDSEAVIKQVPMLQACSRGVYVFFDAQGVLQYDPDLKVRGTHRLSDGRELHVYTENPNRCTQTNFDDLVDYILKADSY